MDKPLWVVKLGGSLAHSNELPLWLAQLSGFDDAHLVIVPGGGPFADAVRVEQSRIGFGERCAHHLALLAMVQYGYALADLCPEIVPTLDLANIGNVLERGRAALWLGVEQTLADPQVAQNWSVTSDALALWLAKRLGATGLVLVKSVPAPAGSVEDWSRNGYVDSELANGLDTFAGAFCCLGVAERAAFVATIAQHSTSSDGSG